MTRLVALIALVCALGATPQAHAERGLFSEGKQSFGLGLGGGADEFVTVVDTWHDTSIPCVPHAGAGSFTPWQMPPSCDPLFRTSGSTYKDLYQDAVGELLDGPFSEESVGDLLAAWTNQISDAVDEVHQVDPEQVGGWEWIEALSDLNARIEYLREQAYGEL